MIKNSLGLITLLLLLTSCASYPFKVHYDLKSGIPIKITKELRVALVLGGGGARAIAHLGVLEALEQNNIPIDLIVGTSGGSIIGALYADDPHVANIKQKAFNFKQADLLSFSLLSAIDSTHSLKAGYIDGSKGEQFLIKNMKAKNFNQLKIPFVAVCTDIVKGATVPISSGVIAPAVRASYSIPGLFAPVEVYGMTLVDGGVTAPLGVEVAKKYSPKVLIAVDVSLPLDKRKVGNMLELTYRALDITYNTLNEALGKQADILIKPELDGAGIFDDHKRNVLYKAGFDAAMKMMPEIKKRLRSI